MHRHPPRSRRQALAWLRPLAGAVGLVVAAAAASAPTPARAGVEGAPRGADPARADAAAELAVLGRRIEALKREVAAGRARGTELEPLLARAQELAAFLDHADGGRTPAAPPTVSPDAQELRERADALRDRADRLDRELQQVDQRLATARRRAQLEDRLRAVGGPGDLFSDTTPRGAAAALGSATASATPTGSGGASSSPPATSSAPGSTSSAPSTSGAPPNSGAPPPSTATPTSGAPSAGGTGAPEVAPRAAATPGGGGEGPRREGVSDLRRRRAEVAAEIDALRAQADALDSEARGTERLR